MSCPRCDTAGTIVEIVGAQGAGKTTLRNELDKDLKTNWFFRHDLRHIGPAEDPSGTIERLHRDIYFRRLRHLDETQPDPWKSLTVARQASNVIGQSLTMMTNKFPRGFFLDEGIFNNFPLELANETGKDLTPLWANRAMIYLRTPDPDLIVSRYQGRVETRSRKHRLHRQRTDSEVREAVRRKTELFDRVLEKARSLNRPVIVINPADNHGQNIEKILEFEKGLRTEPLDKTS